MLPALAAAAIPAALNIAGTLFGQDKEAKLQKKFAQNAIQWKVADATKAGIHPLYALGANTVSYAPQGLGSSLGDIGRDFGQDISRAVAYGKDAQGRADDMSIAYSKLQLERGALENELLRRQIAQIGAPGSPPSLPSDRDRTLVAGQGDSKSPMTLFDGFTIKPRPSETSAQRVSDEYGEAADWVGGWRLVRDSINRGDEMLDQKLWSIYEAMKRANATGLERVRRRSRSGGRW